MEFYHRVILNADTRIVEYELEESSGEGSGEPFEEYLSSGSEYNATEEDYQFFNELDWMEVQMYQSLWNNL